MHFLFWLSVACLACLSKRLPNTKLLAKRWGSECLHQDLGAGEWHRALVDTYHRFAGSEEKGRVIGCYYHTAGEAEAEVRDTCAFHSDADNGCYWRTLSFETLIVPDGGSSGSCRKAESPPPQGGCYQLHDNCANYNCKGQSKHECKGVGAAWFGCGWAEPPPPPEETRPNQPLHFYHPGCDSVHRSRTPECVAAMHRYCWYTVKKGSAAIPQEAGIHDLGFLCADTNFYDNVPYADIPGCDRGQSQSGTCYHAAHQYCDKIGKGGVGIVQEVTSSVAGLACVPYATYQSVKTTTLQQYQPGCKAPSQGQNPDCASAVHNYCVSNGLGQGGAVAELGLDEVAVGCIQGGKYVSGSI